VFFPYFFVIYFNAFATTITMRDSQQKEFNKLQIAKKEKNFPPFSVFFLKS